MKARKLKDLINSNSTEFLCEAHNGISAKIVEETGFKGIWASGLTLSAQYGVRDNNEASWTQILEMVEFMSDATTIPILLDGDTGYGNFNSFRRLVRKLEQIEVAGVCIEDKLFPKTNSFISGEKQQLADADEFAGKIKAGKDTQQNKDFVIIARTEALIAGWGLKEALRRSQIYMDAGADGILIHSSKSSANEILQFCKEWDNRLPVVIVPTKYYKTPTKDFSEARVSIVVWANHILRSAVKSMQDTSMQIYQEKSLITVEKKIVSVNEVFRLQNAPELEFAEDIYLPLKSQLNAVILAAGDEKETDNKIQSLLKIEKVFKSIGVISTTCVINEGLNFESDYYQVKYVNSMEVQSEILSLFTGLEEIKDIHERGLLIQYGDVIIPENVLRTFLFSNEKAIKIIGVDYKHSSDPKKTLYDIISLSEDKMDHEYFYLDTISLNDSYQKFQDLLWAGVIYIPAQIVSNVLSICEKLMSQKFPQNQLSIVSLVQELLNSDLKILVELKFGRWIKNSNSKEIYIL